MQRVTEEAGLRVSLGTGTPLSYADVCSSKCIDDKVFAKGRRSNDKQLHSVMRITIIGGTGHVGTYLVPMLVEAGHEITCVSRSLRQPYQAHASWKRVTMVQIDRLASESTNRFGKEILALQPEVVIDMICFEPGSAKHLHEHLNGRIQQLVHCGTMWVHGHSVQVPVREDAPRKPFGDYGIAKAAIEKFLLDEHRASGFPATILHPGHIVGPGWVPLNPAGNFNPAVFKKLKNGEELVLPNIGMETVHHVHARDVAQAFLLAVANPAQAIGENFHVVSPAALTLRGYAELMADWFGKPLRLSFLPWGEWKNTVSENDAAMTWDHIAHSPNGSIEKARRMLHYNPEYASIEAVQESVLAMTLT